MILGSFQNGRDVHIRQCKVFGPRKLEASAHTAVGDAGPTPRSRTHVACSLCLYVRASYSTHSVLDDLATLSSVECRQYAQLR